jgi:hypothetical protein
MRSPNGPIAPMRPGKCRGVTRLCPSIGKAACRPREKRWKYWLPFVLHYRTMCIAPDANFRRMLEDIRELHLAV